MTTRLIIRQVTDTRERDPMTGKPVAGTGDPVPCSHCGRSLVVHVHVVDCELVKDPSGWRVIGQIPVEGTARIIGSRCVKLVGADTRVPGAKWMTREVAA